MAFQDCREPMDRPELVVTRERAEHRVQLVSRDNQVYRVLLDSAVTVVTVAQVAAQVYKESVEYRERTATVAQLAPLVLLVKKVMQV